MTLPSNLTSSWRFRIFYLCLAFGVSNSSKLTSPTFTPPIVPRDWQDEYRYECEVASFCGGLVFDGIGTPEQTVSPILYVPVGMEFDLEVRQEVFISSKPWLVHRGAVTVSTRDASILRTATDITIDEARAWCQSDEECIAFSFPWKSEKSLLTVDEVVFVNKLLDFDYGDNPVVKSNSYVHSNSYPVEWVTHILHDRSKIDGRISARVDLLRGLWKEEATTPYRPCCNANSTMPTIQELKEADTMERISCNISRADFYEQYEKTRTMVILEGCTDEWKAKHRWSSIERLLDRFDNETLWTFYMDSQHFPDSTWASVKTYYDTHIKENTVETSGGLRLFKRLDPDDVTDTIREDYDPPQPFQDPNLDLYEKLPTFKTDWFPKGFGGPLQWFIVGSYGTGTGAHIDPHSTDAWSTLLSGHKWWTVYPKLPGAVSEMEIRCDAECSDADTDFHVSSKANSWYTSVGKHASKFYYNTDINDGGADIKAQLILQRPGETLYLPHGTIHAVANMDETVAVTEKWASRGNLAEIWRELLTSGQPGDWEALYYHVLNKEERELVREIVWPITPESVKDIIMSHVLYGGKGTDPKTYQYNYDEEEVGQEEVGHEEDSGDEEDSDDEEDWNEEDEQQRLQQYQQEIEEWQGISYDKYLSRMNIHS